MYMYICEACHLCVLKIYLKSHLFNQTDEKRDGSTYKYRYLTNGTALKIHMYMLKQKCNSDLKLHMHSINILAYNNISIHKGNILVYI